jgi:hypothetical protein
MSVNPRWISQKMTVKATDCLSLTICFINRNLSGVEAGSSKQIGGNISQINQRFSVVAGERFFAAT